MEHDALTYSDTDCLGYVLIDFDKAIIEALEAGFLHSFDFNEPILADKPIMVRGQILCSVGQLNNKLELLDSFE